MTFVNFSHFHCKITQNILSKCGQIINRFLSISLPFGYIYFSHDIDLFLSKNHQVFFKKHSFESFDIFHSNSTYTCLTFHYIAHVQVHTFICTTILQYIQTKNNFLFFIWSFSDHEHFSKLYEWFSMINHQILYLYNFIWNFWIFGGEKCKQFAWQIDLGCLSIACDSYFVENEKKSNIFLHIQIIHNFLMKMSGFLSFSH